MKTSKIVITLLLTAVMCIPLSSHAQDNGFSGFYNKYKDANNFTSFNVQPGLARLFMNTDDRELRKMLKHVKQIKLITYESNRDSVSYFSNELNDQFLSRTYEELMTINDGEDHVTFKMRKKENRMKELVMVATDATSLTVIYFKGDIDLSNMKELSKAISGGRKKYVATSLE